MKKITLPSFKSLDSEKKRIISDAVISEACKIMESGYSSCVAVRHVNKTLNVAHDTIYYICGKSDRYVALVDEIKKERSLRHRRFLDMRSIAV